MTKVTNSTTTPPTTGQSTTADPTTQLTTITRTTVTTEPTPATTKTTPPPPPPTTTTTTTTTIPPPTPPAPTTTPPAPTTTAPAPAPTTTTTTTIPPPTPPAPTTTAPAPTTTAPAPTTTTTTTAKPTDILLLAMSFKMIGDFTSDLNDKNSDKYKKYKGDIEPVIRAQYRNNMPGFISATLTSFSRGSVIANFDVRTTAADPTEITKANAGLATSLSADYQVDMSSFNIIYNSSTVLSYKPTTIYSGGTMTLECGPPPDNVKMGIIRNVEWKRKGRVLTSTGRFNISTDDFASQKTKLGIKTVIAEDEGKYECTLKSDEIYFYQTGQIEIKDAPIIQTNTEINTKCVVGNGQPLECCVQTPYKLMWKEGNVQLLTNETPDNCIKYNYKIQNCDGSSKVVTLTCQVKDPTGYEKTTKLTIFVGAIICNDLEYGSGQEKDTSVAPCNKGEDGRKTAICESSGSSGSWKLQSDTCVLTAINELLTSSQDLKEATVEEFLTKLNNTSVDLKDQIVSSSATISTIVDILRIVASVSKNISQSEIKNILETVNVLVSDEAKQSWTFLNADQNKNTSSSLLGSMEFFAGSLPTKSFNVTTKLILLNQDTFDNSFRADLNSSVLIEIPETNSNHLTITTLTFYSLSNVLPARNGSNQSVNDNIINGLVVLVKLNGTTKNVSLSFDKVNKSLTYNPQCVFWNFSLFNSLGGWDNAGCKVMSNEEGQVTCHCNHLTSFSILMSSSIPKVIQDALDIITYVGVGISMGSLVICLIIEACVWKAMTRNNTSYMRHVSIVNIAVSLLIADIWFIIGASISKNTLENPGEETTTPIPACSAATFFIHFFYLALFFWMLISGLLLFYRTVLVFSHMSKSTMLAIGFSVGYGAPLIIAVITVAATAPSGGYINENQACWLNWDKTRALLAFVIPALTIVVINFLILIVVLYKMLRRGVGDATQPDERNAVVVIARCLAILTPFFGLTWGLGVGTMVDPTNKGIHIVFALFNSLQGFFVLVFGTLLDGKIRSAIAGTFSSILPGSDRTRSTSGGAATSSTSALNFIRRRIRRNVYNVSEAANSSNSTGATESFINT
ncbi:adhesion G protein-coupled receptor F4-like isoform X1 [Salvelinus alpinus]|uniref:adhesion G protein-coupled receptor F4-like isoform X1 n=1 Tax=Salvelinus alpinus TaxID=8036 RepID=UPI0039FCEC5F